ncbi:thermonuclease family protein [Caldimonas thermodepolymerans]|jgi:Micrococcal nuclease (thermonuclease) homologs|uniref:Nuclease n=1 Tax=Caldimonas thermodepolymerans TaxID=215580 RepID=A0A2S5T8T8_9BURK|nr:thermonuclease family protein [Caldimonas thermodepolymerans]PPE71393.1 nuclease [Caldimonas thermodepolymerans]QPC32568.1 thermonuclease family protein [Caldimonas thermodepolymerans]RDH98966.1 endonuclease YncB(thermonuclease family) [Caldimonas thermodepolymerans]TCP06365.1 endonuclease YncB(thermonuclease family) [Caldimonas thermodepolymerans]UZG49122.1 thermonuclease family protein [Caldimonas thermodepolymerans]
MRRFVIASWLALCCLPAWADGTRVVGRVTRVTDGDTLWLRVEGENRKPLKIRIEGIDAPEACQPWGREATEALKARVLGRRLEAVLRARDSYQRWLGTLWLDGEDVAAWMVREGHAWSYRFRRDDGPYAALEREARQARRGLFSQPDPMLPQVFRRWHGPCPPRAAS